MILTLAALLALAATPAKSAPPSGPHYASAVTPAERAFFDDLSKKPAVLSLPGMRYEVITSGPADGPHPKGGDQLSAKYKGSLMDGSVFDQSQGDATIDFQLRQVIPGWQVALKLMRPGDKWRIYIPAYMAYGPAAKPKIPADSPLIFEVELVSVTPAS